MTGEYKWKEVAGPVIQYTAEQSEVIRNGIRLQDEYMRKAMTAALMAMRP